MHDRHVHAMGVQCHLVVNGDAALLDLGANLVRSLSACWTRFEPSEMTRLNERAGAWVRVSPQLFALCAASLRGWQISGGLFNPFLGDRIAAWGYDRDFAEVGVSRAPIQHPASREIPIQIRRRGLTVRLSPSSVLDSGGLGKGLGADLVSAALMRAGAAGALVNLGGDLRVRGTSARGDWQVSVDDPVDESAPAVASLTLRAGAVCTSSWLGRRWLTTEGDQAHHLLDPRTGAPATTNLRSATVIAPSGMLAEVLAKVVFLSSPTEAARMLRRHRAGAVVVTPDGRTISV